MIRQYEAATGRLSAQIQNSAGVPFNDFGYDYSDRGNITSINETGDIVRAKAYSYDELERLTEVSVPAAPSENETYALDPDGNRISSYLSATHETDESNRLTSDERYTYVYDLNGNLLAANDNLDGTSGAALAFTYD